jgi:hypothetical protein
MKKINNISTSDYPSDEELQKMIELISLEEIATDKNIELPF